MRMGLLRSNTYKKMKEGLRENGVFFVDFL